MLEYPAVRPGPPVILQNQNQSVLSSPLLSGARWSQEAPGPARAPPCSVIYLLSKAKLSQTVSALLGTQPSL